MAKIAVIQMCSSDDIDENLRVAQHLIARAKHLGADMIVFPEMFAMISMDLETKVRARESEGDGIIQRFLSHQAKHHGIWVIGGTIPLVGKDSNKARAACLVFDPQGRQVARYDKIHLFDVMISEQESYKESDAIEAGDSICVFDTPLGKVGLAVCYDIRFPELFRLMFNQGVEIFIVPAAFTVTTGQAHWELLARARAVENFCYFIGACQGGTHISGRKTFGHSLIVDPWGEVKALLQDGVGVITAELDLEYLHKIREKIPAKNHQRFVQKDSDK